jgi:hypothetical protein
VKISWIIALLMILLGGCVVADEAPKSIEPKSIDMSGLQPMMAANTRCFPTRALLAGLLAEHGERQAGVGRVRDDDQGLNVFVSLLTSDQGSWTVIISGPSGHSCLMVWGEGWQMRGTNKAAL